MSQSRLKKQILANDPSLNKLPLSKILKKRFLPHLTVSHPDGRKITLNEMLHKTDKVAVMAGKMGEREIVVKAYEFEDKDTQREIEFYRYMKKYAEKGECNLIKFYTGFTVYGRPVLVLDRLQLLSKENSYTQLGVQILDQLRCLHKRTTYNSLKDENIVWRRENGEERYYLIDFGSVAVPSSKGFRRKSWPHRWASQSKEEKITFPYYDFIELGRVMKHLWNLQHDIPTNSKTLKSGYQGRIKKFFDYVKKLPKVNHYSSQVYSDLQKILDN